MILVDTSVWIDHLRRGNAALVALLDTNQVCVHPAVIGELACGNLGNRLGVLGLLRSLPRAQVATDDEVLAFIDRQQLMGRGIGYVDTHLLAACILHPAKLLTQDKRLEVVAGEMGLIWQAAQH